MHGLRVVCMRIAGHLRPSGFGYRMVTSASQQPAWGSGVGKGGGAGGTVRELGGAFGQREAAEEEIYFRKLAEQQFRQLHDLHMEEIRYLEREMKEHAAAIVQQKQKLRALKKIADTRD